ncbi:very-long-chain (3R)-3-hydroxyacyl-CoA dehydratase 3-like isoform X2 [Branchiostoma floridae x Branchiostoma belcheri]
MAGVYTPFVYWAQRKDKLSLKVDLRDVSDPNVQLDEYGLTFRAYGFGAKGQNEYGFQMDFFKQVDPEKSMYRTTPQGVEFMLMKQDKQWWSRLVEQEKRPGFLKVDFDKWRDEGDSESEAEEEKARRLEEYRQESLKKFEEEMKEEMESRAAIKYLKTWWLFAYNFFQFMGYSFIFVSCVIRYMMHHRDSFQHTWEFTGQMMMTCQLMSFLEYIHAEVGLVNSKPLFPLIQTLGRNFILFLVIYPEELMYPLPVVTYLFTTWSCIEVVRYPFYLLTLIGKENLPAKLFKVTQWLRYSIWIPLYPLGFLLEAYCIFTAVPYYERSNKFSYQWGNIRMHYPLLMKLYLMMLAAGGTMLLKYMVRQRRRKAAVKRGKEREKAAAKERAAAHQHID